MKENNRVCSYALGSSNVKYDGYATWSLEYQSISLTSIIKEVKISPCSLFSKYVKRKNGARKTRVATSFVILLSQGEEEELYKHKSRTWNNVTS